MFCFDRDNYGFVTYYDTKDAFTAIENGSKLRKPDELPFDLCFGGRRQFCQATYSDLGRHGFYIFRIFKMCSVVPSVLTSRVPLKTVGPAMYNQTVALNHGKLHCEKHSKHILHK